MVRLPVCRLQGCTHVATTHFVCCGSVSREEKSGWSGELCSEVECIEEVR